MGQLFDFILFKPLGYVIRFAYMITNNYLLAILLFALIIEIILSPLQIKQQKSSIKQAKLQPKVKAIQKKYAGRNDNVSKQKMQQEIMDLYRQENFNPAGGCLPLLIQLPVIIVVWQIITQPLKYICGMSDDLISKLTNSAQMSGAQLGTYSQMGLSNLLRGNSQFAEFARNSQAFKDFGYNYSELQSKLPEFKLFGLDLSPIPTFKSWLIIIPILVFLAMWGSMAIMKKFTYQPPEAADAQNKLSMRIMNLAMPALSTWFSFRMPAVVGVYWIFRNILSVGERFIITKIYPIPRATDEELAKAEKEYAEKQKEEKKAPVRSLHRIDWDDEELPPPVIEDEDDEEEDARSQIREPENSRHDKIERVSIKDDDREDRKEKRRRKSKKED